LITARNVLTIATGKKLYVDMAVNLARSFWLWNSANDINFYLVTDLPQNVPNDIKTYIKIITIQPGELGKGFSPKLHLDKLAPEGQTLFIDSDCLIYGNISRVFEKFSGHAVSVVGGYISSGEWFGDVTAICKKFNVKQLPKFNGGIYYIENGDRASLVYTLARKLETQYDDIGFVRLRNRPNDEVIMALAMELSKEKPVTDDGSILAEFINFQSGIKSDLLNGVAELYNDPAHSKHQKNWHLTLAKPLIVHFLGHYNQILPYTKEVKQLEYILRDKYNLGKARLLTFVQVTLPSQTVTFIKDIIRPAYHIIAGARLVKKSERVVD
jgi:hypothetical protein